MRFVPITLKEIRQEADDCRTYLFAGPRDFTWQEGTHTHVGLAGFSDGEKPNKDLVHHYSISILITEGMIGITTRVKEPMSVFKQTLDRLQPGDQVVLFKWGGRLQLRRENRPLVLLSQGVGLAALRPLMKAFCEDGNGLTRITNIHVAPGGSHIFQKELEKLRKTADSQGRELHHILCDGRQQFAESLTQNLDTSAVYYVVGSDAFVQGCVRRLRAGGIAEDDIVLDKKEEEIAVLMAAAGEA